MMPPVNAIEVTVLAAALLLFSVIPAIFNLATNLRRRAAQPPAFRPVISAGPAPEPQVVEATPAGEAAPETVPAEATPAIAEEVSPASAPQGEIPASVEERDEGGQSFCLDDLRHARALETPDREALRVPERQQAWEEGIRLAEAHGAKIGRMPLSASFQPQARAFHDMHRIGEIRELRFLLFPTLWPTAAEQATAEAVFEIGADGVTGARVIRRAPA